VDILRLQPRPTRDTTKVGLRGCEGAIPQMAVRREGGAGRGCSRTSRSWTRGRCTSPASAVNALAAATGCDADGGVGRMLAREPDPAGPAASLDLRRPHDVPPSAGSHLPHPVVRPSSCRASGRGCSLRMSTHLPRAGPHGRPRHQRPRRPRLHDLRHSFAVAHPPDCTAGALMSTRACRGCRPIWATQSFQHLLVPHRAPDLPGWPTAGLARVMAASSMTPLAPLLEAFFTDRLRRQTGGESQHGRRLP